MSWTRFRRQRLRQVRYLLAPETERLSQQVSGLAFCFQTDSEHTAQLSIC
jgi:hypothetical protein